MVKGTDGIWIYCPRLRRIRFTMYKDCLQCILFEKCTQEPLQVINMDVWGDSPDNIYDAAVEYYEQSRGNERDRTV